jgi:hypothetical protein
MIRTTRLGEYYLEANRNRGISRGEQSVYNNANHEERASKSKAWHTPSNKDINHSTRFLSKLVSSHH